MRSCMRGGVIRSFPPAAGAHGPTPADAPLYVWLQEQGIDPQVCASLAARTAHTVQPS
jgi:hypothetical protein